MRSILVRGVLPGALVMIVSGCGGFEAGDGTRAADSAGNTGAPAPLVPSDYRAPWACGAKYYVSQGNDGDLCTASDGDHVAPLQAYAWDFALPRHTPVAASRAGEVTLVDNEVAPGDDCYDGCPDPFGSPDFVACCSRCLLRSNHVNVEHDDGTVATYWHLDQAIVREGERVAAGQVLGYSGTSGCSTGPHLHFQVMGDCATGFCASIPIRFADADVPACGDRVTSQNGCR
ncbi:MAG TPA: M23 family metallopeptidase [Polyangia bacterium]